MIFQNRWVSPIFLREKEVNFDGIDPEKLVAANRLLDNAHEKQETELAGQGFGSREEAILAGAAMFAPASILSKREVQFHIVRLEDSSYGFSNPHVGATGATQNREPSRSAVSRIAGVSEVIQSAHTHWDDTLLFSGQDALYVYNTRMSLALINKNGRVSNLTRQIVVRGFKRGTRLIIPNDAQISGRSFVQTVNTEF